MTAAVTGGYLGYTHGSDHFKRTERTRETVQHRVSMLQTLRDQNWCVSTRAESSDTVIQVLYSHCERK